MHVDNVIIGGKTKYEHDSNLEKFNAAANDDNWTLNEHRSIYSVKTIDQLGYRISHDPGRLKPLLELPVPNDLTSLNRVLGMFSYYSKWI